MESRLIWRSGISWGLVVSHNTRLKLFTQQPHHPSEVEVDIYFFKLENR